MSRPVILDLYCGAGGAARGYHDAGFDVVGVDIADQPRYPYEFIQEDVRELASEGFMFGMLCAEFDAIHASPPCQAFTQMSARYRGTGGKADSHPDLLTPTLEMLRQLDIPWVVENVVGARAKMRTTLMLHGGMFGLGVHRPRLFESNMLILAPQSQQTKNPIGVYGTKPDGRVVWRNAGNYRPGGAPVSRSVIRAASSIEQAREAMGIDWMTWDEIREAIPPAYTAFIGAELLRQLGRPTLAPAGANETGA